MQNQNKILVVGSIAYDHVMQSQALFKDIMVPGNFNVAITAQDRKVSYGGCGGNIAYSLKLLELDPLLLGVAGYDFDGYEAWFNSLQIDTSAVTLSQKNLTSAAFIVSDPQGNQIAVFDAGVMNKIDKVTAVKKLAQRHREIAWAIIAPDNPRRMVQVAAECKALGIPYIFDPAQQITNIVKKDLLAAIKGARVLIVNEYESGLIGKHLEISAEKIAGLVPIYIETHGAKGARIRSPEGMFEVPAVKPAKYVDPTGCGDAFRAGVMLGLIEGCPIEKSVRVGALLATYNLENSGTQNHQFTLREFGRRFEKVWGEKL